MAFAIAIAPLAEATAARADDLYWTDGKLRIEPAANRHPRHLRFKRKRGGTPDMPQQVPGQTIPQPAPNPKNPRNTPRMPRVKIHHGPISSMPSNSPVKTGPTPQAGGPKAGSAAAPGAAAQPAAAAPTQFMPGEILVTLAPGTNRAEEDAIATTFDLERLESWSLQLLSQRIVRYRIMDARSVPSVLQRLRASPAITGAQANFVYRQLGQANGGADRQYALAKLHVAEAQTIARGKGAIVAVIDSGIDASHPDLSASIQDHFTVSSEGTFVPTDAHGTEMAGILAAHGAALGIAPEATLLDVAIFETDRDGKPISTTLNLIRGLDWASGKQARIFNMSFEGPADPLVGEAVAVLARRGIILVAAAGNGGSKAPPAYPAAYDAVIAVTATDARNARYQDANLGTYIDLAAPGVDVFAPAPQGAFALVTGTSPAAASVSGIVALMLGRNPALTPEDVKSRLEKSAADIGAAGPDSEFGHGLADAFAALQ
jgi:subtilisin family serine protease